MGLFDWFWFKISSVSDLLKGPAVHIQYFSLDMLSGICLCVFVLTWYLTGCNTCICNLKTGTVKKYISFYLTLSSPHQIN